MSSGASSPLPPRSMSAAEEVLLDRGAVRDPVLVHVAVDLRGHHERDVRVAEVAERAFQEARQRHVVGVHRWRPRRSGARARPARRCGCRPWSGPGTRRCGWLYSGRPLRLKCRTPEPRGHRPHRGVVALVEDPHVDLAAVDDLPHPPQGPLHHVDRLLAGHDRGQQRHPQADRRVDRHRVLGVEREHPDGHVLHEADHLDADHHAEADPGGHRLPVRRSRPRPLRDVLGAAAASRRAAARSRC